MDLANKDLILNHIYGVRISFYKHMKLNAIYMYICKSFKKINIYRNLLASEEKRILNFKDNSLTLERICCLQPEKYKHVL